MASQADKKPEEWRLIWEDNFDFFDSSKWEHEVTAWGGGNNEFQVYIPDKKNVYVEDGSLKIRATLLKDNINPKTGKPFGDEFVRSGRMDLWDLYGKCTMSQNGGCFRDKGNVPVIASGRVRTKGRFSFKYGKVEVRAKMPGGDWQWPAIWALPERSVYGGWPKSGEIDMAEIIGNRDLKTRNGESRGHDRMGSALHWGVASNQNRYYKTNQHIYDTNNPYSGWHIYTLEWYENKGLSLLVDGRRVLDVPYPLMDKNPRWPGFWEFGKPWNTNTNPWFGRGKIAPFDQDFHLLLNVAVGGTNGFIPDGLVNQGGRFNKPWNNGMSWRQAKDSFYNKRGEWQWTWEDGKGAMEVDYIRVYN